MPNKTVVVIDTDKFKSLFMNQTPTGPTPLETAISRYYDWWPTVKAFDNPHGALRDWRELRVWALSSGYNDYDIKQAKALILKQKVADKEKESK